MGKPNIYHDNIEDLQQVFKEKWSTLKYYKNRDHIYLDYITTMGPGSGTRAMRALVQLSIDSGFDGKIRLNACYSSHLFYLLMGMIPEEVVVCYIEYKYGFEGQNALDEFRANSQLDCRTVDTLKRILSKEKNIPETQITLSVIQEHRDFLISLDDKRISCIPKVFINQVLTILKQYKTNIRPDTSWLGSITMVLSEEGKARWKEAIRSDEEFELFRDFAHLKPLMTPRQIKQMEQILSKEAPVDKITPKKGMCTRYNLFASATVVGCAVLSAACLATF